MSAPASALCGWKGVNSLSLSLTQYEVILGLDRAVTRLAGGCYWVVPVLAALACFSLSLLAFAEHCRSPSFCQEGRTWERERGWQSFYPGGVRGGGQGWGLASPSSQLEKWKKPGLWGEYQLARGGQAIFPFAAQRLQKRRFGELLPGSAHVYTCMHLNT